MPPCHSTVILAVRSSSDVVLRIIANEWRGLGPLLEQLKLALRNARDARANGELSPTDLRLLEEVEDLWPPLVAW